MIKGLLKKIIDRSGYKVTSTRYIPSPFLNKLNMLSLDFDHVLSKYMLHQKTESETFTFLQIGAFDGVMCDPLRKYLLKYKWQGVMLEPQPAPYESLRFQYGDRTNINIINAALGSSDSKTRLYILEGDNLPIWTKGMASFNRENILKHGYLIDDIQSYIKEIEIDTITFEKIFSSYNIDSLDLLQTDTEGFDAEIIKIFPFHVLKPSIIHFESKHISKSSLEEILERLIAHGYSVAPDGAEDMIAVQKGFI
jgi:FkbM family methyltransferase